MSNSLGVTENALKGSISAVDANTMLLRLAGKQPPKKGETANDQKSKNKGKRRLSGGNHDSVNSNDEKTADRNSTVGTDEEDFQDWYTDEMDESALSNFRDLFNMLDQSKTGIITAENLYEELRRVDSEITYSEVEDVLKKVDKDGNGEVDFDEFLVHMTNMGDLFGDDEAGDDEEQRKKKSRRKRMFYKAITCFSIKQTLADIEKTFPKHAPHVISHYTAGVRLIGLTTRQLERQMKRMQKSAAKNDSPYAKPLQFVQLSRKGKKNIVHRKKTKTIKEVPGSCRDLQQKESVEEEPDSTVGNLTKEIQDTMMMFAQKEGGLVPQDANIIMALRQKLGSMTARIREKKLQTTEESDQSNLSTMPALNKPRSATVTKMNEEKRSPSLPGTGVYRKELSIASARGEEMERKWKRTKKNFMAALGWTTPRIQYIDVPLPSLKMQLSEKPTFNDLYRIRAKAKQAIDAYYHDLRQTEIRNAWNHWDRLYADVIEPEKLLTNFRTVYSAYSPHREEEAFVVCPWKPGPFRILRHIQKPPVIKGQKSPNVTIIGHKPCYMVRPKTVSNVMCRTPARNTPSPISRPCSSLADA